MKKRVSSIDLTSEQLHLVRELLREHIPHAEVWAYGSRVKWTSTPKSDLDLVAHVGKEAKRQICALREAFEESSLAFRVDLFIWDEVPVEFHAQIESGYFVIQAKNKSSICVKTTLGQVLNFRRGHDLPKSKMRLGDIPVAGSNGCIGYHDSFTPISPCITIGRSGNIGIPYFYHQCWAHNTTLYIDNFKGNNPLFLYYYIKTLKLEHYASGSAVPTLNRNHIHPLDIDFIADLQTQKQIAHVLSTIDKKIELNQRINENLEQQAQAVFYFMFANDIIKSTGENRAKLSTLVDIIDNRGKTPPLAKTSTKFPIIDVRSLTGETRVINYNNCSKYVEQETYHNWFRKGHPLPLDILISTVGSVAEIKLFYGNIGCIAQNVIGIRSKEVSPYYLYQYLQYIKPILISYDIGSVQPSIKVTHIIKHSIHLPEKNSLYQYHIISKSISKSIYKNHIQNTKLIHLRDTLLPKLMSGEIDVSQVKL